MTRLMDEAIKRLSELPHDRQDELARRLLDEVPVEVRDRRPAPRTFPQAKGRAIARLKAGFHLGGERFNREALYEERLARWS